MVLQQNVVWVQTTVEIATCRKEAGLKKYSCSILKNGPCAKIPVGGKVSEPNPVTYTKNKSWINTRISNIYNIRILEKCMIN